MRVLMVQRSLRPPGGGNAVGAWMVHALADQHEVATLTVGDWSIAATNAFYGTSIPDRITRHVVSAPWRWLSGLNDDRLTRLRMAAVLGRARRLAAHYDLLITADNFGPFAKPGIQYVHFPADLQRSASRMTAILDVYFTLCDRIVGAPWSDASKNVTLVNSKWTAAGLRQLGAVMTPMVLYPPVVDPGEGLPWAQRDNVFLCIGRFHGSKRIETAIEIVRTIRESSGSDERLLIVGSPVDRAYTARIKTLASHAGDWIEFREDLSRAELNTLMGRSRYGLQAMESEHFGMATAEMTRAGCLVFAHRSGGTPEVLNDEEALLWSTPHEAVEKFKQLDVAYVRARMRDHARKFSSEQFVDTFLRIVAMSAPGIRDR